MPMIAGVEWLADQKKLPDGIGVIPLFNKRPA